MKKVKCIKTGGLEELTLNKEYEVIAEDMSWYRIMNDNGLKDGYQKHLFEEVTEGKKELNIIDAMKMPVGTEFEVVFNDEKIENNTMIIYKSLTGDEECKHMDWKCHPQDTFMKPYDFLINGMFIPIQKPVSFMEVVNSGNKCRVESEILSKVYDKRKDIVREDEYEKEVVKDLIEGKYCYINTIIYALSGRMGCSDWQEFINNGKFYLEED